MEVILHDISKNYGSNKVLKEFSKSFDSGKRYGLLGRNGSGKTTLLKIISGLVLQDSGQITFKDFSEERAVAYIDSNTRSFYQRLSPYENLVFYGALNNLSIEDIDELLDPFFSSFDLSTFKNKPVNKHSLGQVQLLNLIRGFLIKPNILLCDEIFSNLDKKNRDQLSEFIDSYAKRNEIIQIFTSHDSDFIESTSNQIIRL